MATMFSPDEIESMTVSAWERAKAAVAAGDSDRVVVDRRSRGTYT